MFSKDKCYAGIRKCDEFLKRWYINDCELRHVIPQVKNIRLSANEIEPVLVVYVANNIQRQLYDGGADRDTDLDLMSFYANAKIGFINRLVMHNEVET